MAAAWRLTAAASPLPKPVRPKATNGTSLEPWRRRRRRKPALRCGFPPMGDTGLEPPRDDLGVCGHIRRACAVRVRSAPKPEHSRGSAAVDHEAPESLSQSGILRASGALSGLLMRTAFLSGRQDSNLRPPGPQPGALPDCATPRGCCVRSLARGWLQAGDGNRTRPRSLEGFCATTTLRPQALADDTDHTACSWSAAPTQRPRHPARAAPRWGPRPRRPRGPAGATGRTSCRGLRPRSPSSR